MPGELRARVFQLTMEWDGCPDGYHLLDGGRCMCCGFLVQNATASGGSDGIG